ncbi:MAG: hypothetical protein LBR86_05870 [Tannerella sp.]|jgi:hypothetical protein|nr:hypothetical protein [Tannerella sp.]
MKKENNIPKTIDGQLVEMSERVGLAFYTNEKGETEVEVYFADDNMWLSRETRGKVFAICKIRKTAHKKKLLRIWKTEIPQASQKMNFSGIS